MTVAYCNCDNASKQLKFWIDVISYYLQVEKDVE